MLICILTKIFFFQAEDGIRDYKVTGVQTCALPIWLRGGTASTTARGPFCFCGLAQVDVFVTSRLITDPRLCLGSGTDSECAARWAGPTACRGRQSRRGRLAGA